MAQNDTMRSGSQQKAGSQQEACVQQDDTRQEAGVQQDDAPQDASARQGGPQQEAGAQHSGEQHDGAQQGKAERLWTPLFIFIIIMALCSFMVGQGLNSGTSVYLDHLGQGATLAGILAAVFSGSAGVARLACGPVIDNVGRVAVMLAGTAFLFVGTILPVFASGPAVLTVARILQGIGFSAATTASATAASDVLPLSRMGEGIGYYGLAQALAMSVGPALALFLVNTDPAENLFLGLSAMAALSFVFALLCRYEKNPGRLPETASYRQRIEEERAAAKAAEDAKAASAQTESAKVASSTTVASTAPESASAAKPGSLDAAPTDPKKKGPVKGFIDSFFEPRALPGMLPMLAFSPAFGFGIFFMGLYGTSLGYANAGLFYTVSAVGMIAIRLVSKAFMDTVPPIKIMVATVACGLLGFGMVLFGGASELLFYAAGIPYGLCLGVAIPLNQSVAVKNTPAERWGAANAIYLLASDIGIGVASAVWGIVNDAAGFQVTIVCAMCCVVASLVVAWFAYPGHGLRVMTAE